MRIIISPAKKMKVDTDGLPWKNLPVFMNYTERIYDKLKSMSYEELKKLWKCSDEIASQNVQRLQTMDLRKALTPALFSYEGIQYQYMAPNVFTDLELEYIQEHLRILSGFYGILRPFDGVTPYRLEMQAKLKIDASKNLYDYWGNLLAEQLISETKCIVNLASKEYSLSVSKYLPEDIRFITCMFCEEKNGKLIEKGTMCKMARGEMVRYMATNAIDDPEIIKQFCGLNFRYSDMLSDDKTFVFLKNVEMNV